MLAQTAIFSSMLTFVVAHVILYGKLQLRRVIRGYIVLAPSIWCWRGYVVMRTSRAGLHPIWDRTFESQTGRVHNIRGLLLCHYIGSQRIAQ